MAETRHVSLAVISSCPKGSFPGSGGVQVCTIVDKVDGHHLKAKRSVEYKSH